MVLKNTKYNLSFISVDTSICTNKYNHELVSKVSYLKNKQNISLCEIFC